MSHHEHGYPVGTRVDVRAKASLDWHAGTIVATGGEGEHCYEVELDVPVTADEWTGTTRRYGGAELVYVVKCNCGVEKIVPDELLKLHE
jgi:hypothetical protein